MKNIADLMKLPAMKNCYIVAGNQGIFNLVKRMDIQEIPIPEVNRFLLKSEIMFTTFWSSKDKNERIDFVQEMINKGCAGIGIMPEPYLNNKIDEEIIELGNNNSFPIIYIHPDVRWSDIVNQFSLLLDSEKDSMLEYKLTDLMKIFYDFSETKNTKALCNEISAFLDLPVIIRSDNIYYDTNIDKSEISYITSKLLNISNVKDNINIPITIICDNSLIVAYYSRNSFVAIYFDDKMINSDNVNNFHKLAPIILKELNKLTANVKKVIKNVDIIKTDEIFPCRIVLLRKVNAGLLVEKLIEKYNILEQNDFSDYLILLIRNECEEEKKLFKEFNELIKNTKADIFVFSDLIWNKKDFDKQLNTLKYNISTLLYIEGIFSIDELYLLNMLNYAPLDYKDNIFNMYKDELNINAGLQFFETLRLYLVIKNINNLSALLDIHPNSVKYRITKCLKSYNNALVTNLNDISSLKYLTILALLKVEYKYLNKLDRGMAGRF